ncbi:MAG: transcriptional regulator [Gammaproteobacteria bacterium]
MNPGPKVGNGRNGDNRSFLEKAAAAWGPAPDWVVEFAKEADAHGLKGAAATIGCSASLVSNVVNNKYPGDLGRIEEAVRGALMGKTVWCQGVGDDIARHTCLDWQKKPFVPTSPDRARMYRACRDNCPHFRAHTPKPSDGGSDERQ